MATRPTPRTVRRRALRRMKRIDRNTPKGRKPKYPPWLKRQARS